MQFYVYFYLNPSQPGEYSFNGVDLNFSPLYVGVGSKSRAISHINNYKNGKGYVSHTLRSVLNGLKSDPIIIKIFLSESRRECCSIEKLAISHFRKKRNGGLLANWTNGGEANMLEKRAVVGFDLCGRRKAKYESATTAALSVGIHVSIVHGVCRGAYSRKSGGGVIFRYYDEVGESFQIEVPKSKVIGIRRREIHQYRPDGNYIRSWNSLTEAANWHKVEGEQWAVGIKNCWLIGGYLWSYKMVERIELSTKRIELNRIRALAGDPKWLEEEYINKKMSISLIANNNRVSGVAITNWLDKHGIQRRPNLWRGGLRK